MHMATRVPLGMLLALAASVLSTRPGGAEQIDRSAVIGVILQNADSPLRCSDLSPKACGDESIELEGSLFQNYYAIVCVFGGDAEVGVAGMVFGIDYDGSAQSGVDVVDWRLCTSGLEFPSDDWPEAGAGNVVTWDAEGGCERTVPGDPAEGVTAIAGWFDLTAYSTDRLAITMHTKFQQGQDPTLSIADCSAAEYDLDPAKQAGSVGFSDDLSEKGSLPSCRRQEEDTTWGRIKSTYGH